MRQHYWTLLLGYKAKQRIALTNCEGCSCAGKGPFALLIFLPLFMIFQSCSRPRVGEGGGYLNKFNTGRLCLEVQPRALLYTILTEKISSVGSLVS